jgi:cytosine/creatinine deaminase
MTNGFLTVLPEGQQFVLSNATIPTVLCDGLTGGKDGLAAADIAIENGRIAQIAPVGLMSSGAPVVDLKGGMVWPTFADLHTHLDKGHIWDRNPNPTGDFDGAIEAVRADRNGRWSAEDVGARMEFSLRTAYAHGTRLIRTHIDSIAPQHSISFPVFAEMRDRWKDRITLQAAALFPLELIADEAYFADLTATIVRHGGLMGGLTQMGPDLDWQLDTLMKTAARHGIDIDLHVDETADKEVLTLKTIAEAKLRNGFEGTVTVGHCCSLARQDDDVAKATIELVAKADLAVVSLPMCNMYLQDRHAGRTPRWRGVTLINELAAAGVRTAISSDNTRDPFYAYGDLDPVEVIREGIRILHLDHPLDTTARYVTRTPADIMGRPDIGRIAVGAPADLVLFTARRWSEFLSRPQADRIVMRAGKLIDRTLPDYRELDALLGGEPVSAELLA